ncbi:SOS response-associated peptidase family protein [Legionella israelensis]
MGTLAGKRGRTYQFCCLITTEANEFLSDVHHRMPVILDQRPKTLG